MTRFSVMHPAMTAAVCSADNSTCANATAMHIALILDAMILASIFVALIALSSLLGLILITLLGLIILGTTAYRLKDTPPAFV